MLLRKLHGDFVLPFPRSLGQRLRSRRRRRLVLSPLGRRLVLDAARVGERDPARQPHVLRHLHRRLPRDRQPVHVGELRGQPRLGRGRGPRSWPAPAHGRPHAGPHHSCATSQRRGRGSAQSAASDHRPSDWSRLASCRHLTSDHGLASHYWLTPVPGHLPPCSPHHQLTSRCSSEASSLDPGLRCAPHHARPPSARQQHGLTAHGRDTAPPHHGGSAPPAASAGRRRSGRGRGSVHQLCGVLQRVAGPGAGVLTVLVVGDQDHGEGRGWRRHALLPLGLPRPLRLDVDSGRQSSCCRGRGGGGCGRGEGLLLDLGGGECRGGGGGRGCGHLVVVPVDPLGVGGASSCQLGLGVVAAEGVRGVVRGQRRVLDILPGPGHGLLLDVHSLEVGRRGLGWRLQLRGGRRGGGGGEISPHLTDGVEAE